MKGKIYLIVILLFFATFTSQNNQRYKGWNDPQLNIDYQKSIIKGRMNPSLRGAAMVIAEDVKKYKAANQLSAEEIELLAWYEKEMAFEKVMIEEELRLELKKDELQFEKNKSRIYNLERQFQHSLIRNGIILILLIILVILFFKKIHKLI